MKMNDKKELEKAIKDLKNSIYIRKLKQIRKMRGLTQRQLAERCNISIKSVQAYEQGTRKLETANINTILKICEVLNCNLTDILNNEYKKPFGNNLK